MCERTLVILLWTQFPEDERKSAMTWVQPSEGTEVNAHYCYIIVIKLQQHKPRQFRFSLQTSKESVTVCSHFQFTLKEEFALKVFIKEIYRPFNRHNFCRYFSKANGMSHCWKSFDALSLGKIFKNRWIYDDTCSMSFNQLVGEFCPLSFNQALTERRGGGGPCTCKNLNTFVSNL